MKISVFATILSIFLLSSIALAQKNGNPGSSTPQHVVVEFETNNDIFYPFEMVKGSSIYSLAKAFNLSPEKIFQYNRIKSSDNIRTGSIIKIPLSRKQIKTAPPHKQKFIVLTYIVKPGETLYHIAKRKMNTEVNVLQAMNGLQDHQLRQGGEIILGWYPIGQEEEVTHPPKKNVAREPVLVKTDIRKETDHKNTDKEDEVETEKMVQRRLIGFWDKSNSSAKGFFVLTNVAKPGTEIDIYFPMQRTTVSATVLGNIPSETYAQDIEIILSPDTAKKLGIIDRRFSIVAHYVAKS